MTLVLAVERRNRILRSLERSPAISTDDFAAELGVSPETVRRDLIQLERNGMLRRVHGGAAALTRPARLTSAEPVYSERVLEQFEAKQAIGVAAAALVQPGQTAVIDVGTTCLEVARALRPCCWRLAAGSGREAHGWYPATGLPGSLPPANCSSACTCMGNG